MELVGNWEDKGALWVFKEPVDGREYILGVDAAEGVGDDGDNSCVQVIDSSTCEQVAEFYSNCCVTQKFAKIVERLGIMYNNGLLVIENTGGQALAVLNKLQFEFNYENIYYESSGNSERIGVKVGTNNRPIILEAMQSRLLNTCLPIYSTRFVRELETFIWNKVKQKAEAQSGKHDDAIFAMAHAVYVRDQNMRQSSFFPLDNQPILTDAYKLEMFEQIKDEMARGAPEEWIDPSDRPIEQTENDDDVFMDFYARYRPYNQILKEFNWSILLGFFFITNSIIS